MFFERGVAGAQPLHKGGPKARPPKIQKVRRESTPSLALFRFANQLWLSRYHWVILTLIFSYLIMYHDL